MIPTVSDLDNWNFQLEDIQAPATGIDAFFESNPEVITPHGVVVTASFKPGDKVVVTKGKEKGLTGTVTHTKSGPHQNMVSVDLDHPVQRMLGPAVLNPGALKKQAAEQRKIASLGQLNGFVRIASDTLINKSKKDLWALKKNGDSYVIERLFQDGGLPLKG
jgi:hypothetical protein